MKSSLGLCATVAAITLTAPANAAILNFTISGDYSATFQLDSSPTPLPENTVDGYLFGIADVPFSGSPSGLAGITFFHASATGGILINNGFDYLFDANGIQLYTGPESAPTFRQGQFALTGLSTPGNFIVTISAIPEPGSWAMMVAGFALAGCLIRHRRRVRVAFHR
jgi:PEP-CTERM motif